MGGYNGAHYFPYNFALSFLIVTTNLVVLCEYLSQECPLWGTIKGYCIVLYCIVLYCIVLVRLFHPVIVNVYYVND